jgi:hypothetical protein
MAPNLKNIADISLETPSFIKTEMYNGIMQIVTERCNDVTSTKDSAEDDAMPNYITCKICNVHFLNIQIKR